MFIPCQCCGQRYDQSWPWWTCDTCGYRICPSWLQSMQLGTFQTKKIDLCIQRDLKG